MIGSEDGVILYIPPNVTNSFSTRWSSMGRSFPTTARAALFAIMLGMSTFLLRIMRNAADTSVGEWEYDLSDPFTSTWLALEYQRLNIEYKDVIMFPAMLLNDCELDDWTEIEGREMIKIGVVHGQQTEIDNPRTPTGLRIALQMALPGEELPPDRQGANRKLPAFEVRRSPGMKVIVRQSNIACRLCPELFGNAAALERHLDVVHESAKRFLSPDEDCEHSANHKAGLDEHISYAHPDPEAALPCKFDDCAYSFPTRYYLNMHIKNVHASVWCRQTSRQVKRNASMCVNLLQQRNQASIQECSSVSIQRGDGGIWDASCELVDD